MFSSIPVCRVCLKSSLKYIDLDTPLSNDDNSHLMLKDLAREATYIELSDYLQLKLEDMSALNVRQSLCELCATELVATYRFIRKIEETNDILYNTLNELSSKDASGNIFEHQDGGTNVNAEVRNFGSEDIFECKHCKETFFSQYVLDLHIERTHNLQISIQSTNISDTDTSTQFAKETEEEHLDLETYKNSSNSNFNESDNSKDTEYLSDISTEVKCKDYDKFVKCTKCGEVFLSHLIKEHMEMHERIRNFKCRSCSYTFVNRGALMHHYWKIHKSHCRICNKEISQGESMRQHLQVAHMKVVKCTKCDYKCPEAKLGIHMQRVHAEVKEHICDICYKSFAEFSLLKAHLNYHKRKKTNIKSDACTICGNRFSSQNYLQRHMKVHLDERETHQCEHCDKVYITRVALMNHMRVHEGTTINCDVCGKGFVRRHELTVHMRFHTRDYPFQCEICDRKFAIKGHLRSHMWRHQGLKLQCDECGKLFTSSKALNEHSFLHTEMPFPCNYCSKGYPSKQKYKAHLRLVHEIEWNDFELQKVTANREPKPLKRKRPTLVQTDTVLREVEIEEQFCDDPTEDIVSQINYPTTSDMAQNMALDSS